MSWSTTTTTYATTWEHRVIDLERTVFEQVRQLNDLGAKSWELVAVSEWRAYLKRPAQTAKEDTA